MTALFQLIENALTHYQETAAIATENAAEAENTTQATVNAAVAAALQAQPQAQPAGRATNRRTTTDPDKFGATKKSTIERQQEYQAWKSHISRNLLLDAYFFTQPHFRLLYVASMLNGEAYSILIAEVSRTVFLV